jgi:hypothetical protein
MVKPKHDEFKKKVSCANTLRIIHFQTDITNLHYVLLSPDHADYVSPCRLDASLSSSRRLRADLDDDVNDATSFSALYVVEIVVVIVVVAVGARHC